MSPQTCHRFAHEDTAATATEYAVMLAVIVLGVFAIAHSIGLRFNQLYLTMAATIDGN